MAMRTNRLRERLASNDVLLGAALPFFSPELVEWCGLIGFDWVFLDGEHLPLGVESCYDMVRAADAVGLATLARLPRNEAGTVLSYAESGVDGVMVPHVTSTNQAEALVSSLRFPPNGTRGALSTSRAAGYGIPQSATDYFADKERHAMAVPLIEDESALPSASAIAVVDGVEAIFIGPGDLAMSMGFPGQVDHPTVRDRIDAVVTEVRAAGVPVGTAVGTADAASDAIQRGFRLIVVSLGGLMAASVRDFLSRVRAGN